MQKYISKIQELFLHPGEFIKSVSKEKNHWEIAKFFIISYVSFVAITIILNVLISLRMGLSISALEMGIRLIKGIIYAFAIPYVGAGIIHLGIMIFGGKKGYFNTLKPAIYGFSIYLIYSLLSVLVTGISQLIKPIYPGTPASQIYATIIVSIAGILALVGIVFMIYVQTLGIELSQKMSRIKAFFGVIIIPLILLIIYIAYTVIALRNAGISIY